MNSITSFLVLIAVFVSLVISYWASIYFALVFFAISVLVILLWRTTF